MESLLEKTKDRIGVNFEVLDSKVNIDQKRVDVFVKKENIPSVLLYVKEQMGFKHLMHMSVVDWLEEGEFEIVFFVWAPKEQIKLYIKTRIDRDNPVMENMDTIWPQLNTYEREFKEMYGIEFTGLVAPDEFILEAWDGPPPMRRDFETDKFAKDNFATRPGREDAED
ncbi:MAG TPA: hypothetical protein ENK91_16335, partial [Bacteroidetes bacterium]|nr:hypothetical protein [Bacteroidota bacterium]